MLFADVADSNGLYARFGGVRARAIVADCLATMAETSRRHGGQIIKTIGDEIMCRFGSADEAVRAACGIHEALECRERHDGAALAAHVGLHYGPAFLEDDDVHGDAANIAAGMTTIAKPRQTITTRDTVRQLSLEVAALTRLYDVVTLKGSQREMPIYEVLWEHEDVTSILKRADFPAWAVREIHLSHRSNELITTPDAPPVLIGRGSVCNLVVVANLVSRIHARIEYHRDKFVLIDQSTNGTFVHTENARQVYLRREEMPLFGRGYISLGRIAPAGDGDSIQYAAE